MMNKSIKIRIQLICLLFIMLNIPGFSQPITKGVKDYNRFNDLKQIRFVIANYFSNHTNHIIQNTVNEKVSNKSESIRLKSTITEKISGVVEKFFQEEFNYIVVIENIIIDNEIANVDLNLQLFDENEFKEIAFSIKLAHYNEQWYIIENGNAKFIRELRSHKKASPIVSHLKTSGTRISNETLIAYPHIVEPQPEFYDINRNVTNSEINVNLFASYSEIDMEKIYYEEDYNKDAAFSIDPRWNRIIYGKRGSTSIKEFQHPEFKHLSGISAETSDDYDGSYDIFVTDNSARKIFTLKYDPIFNRLNMHTNFAYPNIINPSDISVYPGNPDQLWIAECASNKIVVLNRDGSVEEEYTEFTYNGTTYPIERVIRLEIFRSSSRTIAFIDKAGHRLVIGKILAYWNNELQVLNVIDYPDPSNLSDIGFNVDNEIICADNGFNSVYKYNLNGEYICTFNNSTWFNLPSRVSNIGMNQTPLMTWQLYIANQWQPQFGVRRYLPTSEVYDFNYSQIGYSTLKFDYFLTGDSYLTLEILEGTNVVKTIRSNSLLPSGSYTDLIPYAEIAPGNYTAKIRWRYWNDSHYHSFSQGEKHQEISFTVADVPHYPPIISSITQSPSPITIGSYGYLYAHLSQGDTPITYTWEVISLPAGAYLTNLGDRCRLTYPNSSSSQSKVPVYEIKCTATNAYGSSSLNYLPLLSNDTGGGSGCPTLGWFQDNLVNTENTILINSISNPGQNVTDYYLLNYDFHSVNKILDFVIYEPENEHTYLNYVELLEVRGNPNEEIAVTQNGEVINFKVTNTFPQIILNDTLDITSFLSSCDSLSFEFNEGDVIQIGGDLTKTLVDSSYLVISGEKPIQKDQKAITILTTEQYSKSDPILIQELFLRNNSSTVCSELGVISGNIIQLEFNQNLILDRLLITKNEKTAKTRTLLPKSAYKNSGKDELSNLSYTDTNYTVIHPSESVILTFERQDNGVNRRYIFKSVGHYSSNGAPSNSAQLGKFSSVHNTVPTEFELKQNFPNPFNPQTVLEYSIPKSSHVTLTVYNTLGQEIIKLQDGFQEAGTYKVTFDATSLASGVYIYKLNTNSFTNVKKMVLLK
ncbi:MAG: T9SS type A sorting domain-containing protein [Melioribacteraceae bacterium]|nr:T9SS type A sorting domain-containing protein [Melioribacteraceae bacterium]